GAPLGTGSGHGAVLRVRGDRSRRVAAGDRAAQSRVQRAAAHRLFRRALGALRAARCAVRRRHPDHHLCRRHYGPVPVRRHAAERPSRGDRGGPGARPGDARRPAGPDGGRRAGGGAGRGAVVGAHQERRRVGELSGRIGVVGGRDRAAAVHRLRVRLRGHVGADSGGPARGRRPGAAGGAIVPALADYLVLSSILFAIGAAGVFVRRNLITILLSIEIMLNAVNLAFVAFGRALGAADGQIIVFFVMTVAAAEAAVGLAIVIALFRHRESLNPDTFTALKW